MPEPIRITQNDSRLEKIVFGNYRCTQQRKAVQFLPDSDEPQKFEIKTPWGALLEVTRGDYLVCEMDRPEDKWPVEEGIFESTYVEVAPGIYQKSAITRLVPLTEIVPDPMQTVIVETLEGDVEVRAGEFYLAKGVEGEIWPYPAEEVRSDMERIA